MADPPRLSEEITGGSIPAERARLGAGAIPDALWNDGPRPEGPGSLGRSLAISHSIPQKGNGKGGGRQYGLIQVTIRTMHLDHPHSSPKSGMGTIEEHDYHERTVSNFGSTTGSASRDKSLEIVDSGIDVDPWTASDPWIDIERTDTFPSALPISRQSEDWIERKHRKKKR